MLVAIRYYFAWRAKNRGRRLLLHRFLAITLSPLSARSSLVLRRLALAFGHQVPLFPVHTGCPDVPTLGADGRGVLILACVLLKMAPTSLLRVAIPLFRPAVQAAGPGARTRSP